MEVTGEGSMLAEMDTHQLHTAAQIVMVDMRLLRTHVR